MPSATEICFFAGAAPAGAAGQSPAIPRSRFGLNEAQRQLAITSLTCMIGSIFV